MKGLLLKSIILGLLSMGLVTNVSANKDNNKAKKPGVHLKWLCETNASAASTEDEKNADEKMSTKAKSAKDAFSYAYKNCRDCTKITCTVHENGNGDQKKNDRW